MMLVTFFFFVLGLVLVLVLVVFGLVWFGLVWFSFVAAVVSCVPFLRIHCYCYVAEKS